MTKTMLVLGVSIVGVVLVGCSGGDGGTNTGDDKAKSASTTKPAPSAQPAQTTNPTDPNEMFKPGATLCAVKGDKGNALGVGAYCEKGGTCGENLFCTADFAAPEGAQFCTLFCSSDADCGADMTCYHEARGTACVPTKCAGK